MNNKYIDGYVSLGILVAIIVMLVALFLSSCSAEAHYGTFERGYSVAPVRHQWGDSRLSADAAGLYIFERDPFEQASTKGVPPVLYLFIWPRLPSVAEQNIRMANDRLREVVHQMDEVKARRAYTSLMLDWQRLWLALGEGLLALGIISVILAFWNKDEPSKSDTDLT